MFGDIPDLWGNWWNEPLDKGNSLFARWSTRVDGSGSDACTVFAILYLAYFAEVCDFYAR